MGAASPGWWAVSSLMLGSSGTVMSTSGSPMVRCFWISAVDGMVAVVLRFDDGQLTVYNALDENGLSFGPPMDQYVSHWPA